MSHADVNVALCEALGLDPANVQSIRIDITKDSFPIVEVKSKLRDALADEWTSELDAKYKLVPVEDDAE